MHLWSHAILRVCHVRVIGQPKDTDAQMIFSNHIGYLDIVALYSIYPDAKVIAAERVRDIFLIGKLIAMSGAIFVQRDSVMDRARTRKAATDLWKEGKQIAVCPEGTVSYTGKPFKPGMFKEAVKAGVKVQPIKIIYDSHFIDAMNGEDFEKRLMFVTSQDIEITLQFFPPFIAKGDGGELCAKWQKKLVGI